MNKLNLELFSKENLEIVKTTLISSKSNSSISIESLETVIKHVDSPDFSFPVFMIDDYDAPLGSIRLTEEGDTSYLEFSNGNKIEIHGGVEASDIINMLYESFGSKKEKVRITSFMNPNYTLSPKYDEIDNQVIVSYVNLSKDKLSNRVFNLENTNTEWWPFDPAPSPSPSPSPSPKPKPKCNCGVSGMCKDGKGARCNAIKSSCHGSCVDED